ncbi:MAG: S1 RNA-binding domain-containing protein [Acidobacteria bacterium]|nr:S1 RNA-binding domain-containing protein [Acidobacteriota bacterium]
MIDPEEDFASMFEASLKAKRVEKGQSIEGAIVAIGDEVAFVNIGGKGEAQIELAELKNAEGVLELAVGDRIQATVIATEGGVVLSRKLALGAVAARQIEDAYHSHLAVEGKVEREVKGGYEIRIGGQRAFCPFSQIDIIRNTEPAQHIGQVYPFRIIEYKEGGKNIILSRRALLEDEQKAVAEEIRRSIVVGAVLTGRVRSVRDFGAFVDLGGGVEGLLHVSEMGWSRIADTSQVVAAGEEITVMVLRVDDNTQKISLGLKQLSADPWTTVQTTYAVGQRCTGRVTRVTEFGAFVEIAAGVEALAHVSTFPPTGQARGWTRLVPVGTTATFEILTIDPDKKRIGVAMIEDGAAEGPRSGPAGNDIAPGVRITGKIERHEPFGVFVFLAPGRTGLMPLSETGLGRDADVKRAFPVGSDVEVIVLEVDGRRIRLSRKAVFEAQEAAEVREYRDRPDSAPSSGFGSLADKLRGALSQGRK